MNTISTQYLFFTGKGGVGKTSLSCATAVKMADDGKKILLVSTDPASNLRDVLNSPVSEKISSVKGLKNLSAININPEVSADEYLKRVTEPLNDFLPAAEIKKMQEELSGACTTEIASFDEFSRFISGENEGGNFDVIIFDTAPTGHTLRLLELPAAWAEFSEENPDGASCLGPTSALKSSQERYNKVVATLRDTSQTTFYLVSRAEKSSLKKASRTREELKELGLNNQKLLVNGVFKALDHADEFAIKLEQMAKFQLDSIPENLQELEQQRFPLLPYNVLGIEKLRSLLDEKSQEKVVEEKVSETGDINPYLKGIDEQGKKLLLEDLRSPCTEEVAVFHAFSKAIQQAKRKFVVIDTAPTGHTLLLLDTAGSYHREVMRNTGMDPAKIKTPYMALQDSKLSKVIVVSLPETTPMREAAALQDDLKRAGITPYFWLVNQSLSMHTNLKDPLLKSRAMAEGEVIQTIKNFHTERIYGIPFIPKEALLPALLDFYNENQLEKTN